MLVIEVLIVAALLVAVAAVAAGRGGSMSETAEDAPDLGLPDDRLSSSDVPRLRFRSALRGYRMADVDEALDRLQAALAQREDELRTLRPVAAGRFSARDEPFEPVPSPEPIPPQEPEPVVPGPEPVVPGPEPSPSPEPSPAEEAEAAEEPTVEPDADEEPTPAADSTEHRADVLQRLRRATDGHD